MAVRRGVRLYCVMQKKCESDEMTSYILAGGFFGKPLCWFRLVACWVNSLRNRHDWTGSWIQRRVAALKYIFLSIQIPIEHCRFLTWIANYPLMDAYRKRDPRLMERYLHRYINTRLRRRDRLAYLQQHYRFMMRRVPQDVSYGIYVMSVAWLGSLTARDGSLLRLCMRPPVHKDCEGELCLQLCDVNQRPLYSVVFTVAEENSTIMIGSVQGPRCRDARQTVRDLTRNLYGMRPKQFMLCLVYMFAKHFGIRWLVAVSNDAHPLRRHRPHFFANYDAFWEEQQGRRAADGWYVFPPSISSRPEQAVPSRHRVTRRRREVLRREAEQLLVGALA